MINKLKVMILFIFLVNLGFAEKLMSMRLESGSSSIDPSILRDNEMKKQKINKTNVAAIRMLDKSGYRKFSISWVRGFSWHPILSRERATGWRKDDGINPYSSIFGISISTEFRQTRRLSFGFSVGLIGDIIVYKMPGLLSLVAGGVDSESETDVPTDYAEVIGLGFFASSDIFYYLYQQNICIKIEIGIAESAMRALTINPVTAAVSDGSSSSFSGFAGVGIRFALNSGWFADIGYRLNYIYMYKQIYDNPLPTPYKKSDLVIGFGVNF